ncbi:MAG: protein translocase subunit SecF [Rickettsiales bacterium]|nr:protein translocase subunit SecF [Rickettsiales bacterium]RPG13547.1 MAG: protein translocase subunit SecF [Pelagibacteraceae bacterium TMED195]
MSIINFYRYRISAFIFSLLLILFSIFLFIKDNLNLGIDFKGGILIEANFKTSPDLSDLREQLIGMSVGNFEIQEFGSSENILIRIEKNSEKKEEQNSLINNIKNELPSEIDYRRIEFVGPKVGKELQIMGIKAVLFSLIAMFAYIWFRFSGWQFGLGALVALFHDVLSTIGFFSLTQIEFNLASIAAILTIAGYSINDTVVVFDRIRENLSKKESPFSDLLNLSISQTLSRTLMTSLTTLLALFALYIFGGEVVRGFVSAMMWGVLIGTYSSIFIASPLIALLGFKIFKQNQ